MVKGVMKMEQYNLVKNTLDQISQAGPNARHIVGLVKEGGRITGYKLSDETFVSKPEAVSMAKARADRRRRHRPQGRYGIPEIHPKRK